METENWMKILVPIVIVGFLADWILSYFRKKNASNKARNQPLNPNPALGNPAERENPADSFPETQDNPDTEEEEEDEEEDDREEILGSLEDLPDFMEEFIGKASLYEEVEVWVKSPEDDGLVFSFEFEEDTGLNLNCYYYSAKDTLSRAQWQSEIKRVFSESDFEINEESFQDPADEFYYFERLNLDLDENVKLIQKLTQEIFMKADPSIQWEAIYLRDAES